jgi:hypothetical protein
MKRSSWLYDEDAALKVIPVGLRREILSALRVGPNPKPQTLNLREILSALRVGPNPKLAGDIERIAGRSRNGGGSAKVQCCCCGLKGVMI